MAEAETLTGNQIQFWKEKVLEALRDDPNSLLRMEVMKMMLPISMEAGRSGLTKQMIQDKITKAKQETPLGLGEEVAEVLQPDAPPQETRKQGLDRVQRLMLDTFDQTLKQSEMDRDTPPGPSFGR